MADSAAALVDERLRPPRQGDSDEGRALLLDAPAPTAGRRCWRSPMRWSAGSTGGRGRPADAGGAIVGALAGARHHIEGRPARRPSRFADAGNHAAAHDGRKRDLVPLRRRPARIPQHRRPRPRRRAVGGGPLRRAWTSSPTRAPTAITASPSGARTSGRRSRTTPPSSAAGASRARAARSCGCSHAQAREVEVIDDGDIATWTAEHDGYASLDPPARHRRSVLLDRASRSIDIIDEIEGGSHDVRLAFHLGPEVQVQLDEGCAALSWPDGIRPGGGAAGAAHPGLRWSLHRGEIRSHPRLVLSRPGTPRPRFQPARQRAVGARSAADHAAGISAMWPSRRMPAFPGRPYHGAHQKRDRSAGGEMQVEAK